MLRLLHDTHIDFIKYWRHMAIITIAWILIGERVRNYTFAAIAVTVAGVAFMVSGPGAGGSTSGALVALVIPLSFGYGTVMIRRHSEIAMAPAMLVSAAISSVISLPFAHPFDITRHDLLLLLAFGFAQLGIGPCADRWFSSVRSSRRAHRVRRFENRNSRSPPRRSHRLGRQGSDACGLTSTPLLPRCRNCIGQARPACR